MGSRRSVRGWRTGRKGPEVQGAHRSHMQRVQIIDSHTGGEPTRVVIAGGPDLGLGSMAQRSVRVPSLNRFPQKRPRGKGKRAGMPGFYSAPPVPSAGADLTVEPLLKQAQNAKPALESWPAARSDWPWEGREYQLGSGDTRRHHGHLLHVERSEVPEQTDVARSE